MATTSSEIEPYIDRSYYDSTLQSLREKNNPALLIGYRNPYNGKVIRTEADADSYLQQQALSTMYRTAANIALARQSGGYEARIKVLEDRISDLEKKRKHPLLAILLLCVAFFAGSQLGTQSAPDRSAPVSNSSTYTYNQPASTPRPIIALTATPQSKPATAKPKATATPAPKSATYRTKPKSGYNLTRTVYVSQSGGKIHLRSNCSGMKYYNTMTYGEACERGYTHCKKCF